MACKLCGGTGVILSTGERCTCGAGEPVSVYGNLCTTVPLCYRGIRFNKELLPPGFDPKYGEFLDSIAYEISRGRKRKRNFMICSPMKSGKTIFVYSMIQDLFSRRIPTFPLLDTGELRRLMIDLDAGKDNSFILEEMDFNPKSIYTVPYLFVKVSDILQFSTFETLLQIIDRRSRRDKATIIISNHNLEYLMEQDRYAKLTPLLGDGNLGTVYVQDFTRTESTYEV